MANITQSQLDLIVQQNLDDGCAFPYLMTHCPRALALLDQLIKAGQSTHGPMDWLDLGTEGNIDHATKHIKQMMLQMRVRTIGDYNDHWLNAVCRLMMALEIREAIKEGSKLKPS